MNAAALQTARKLADSSDHTARWVGKQAIRELTSEKALAGVDKREAAAAKRR